MRAVIALLALAFVLPARGQPSGSAGPVIRIAAGEELAPLWSRWASAYPGNKVEVAVPGQARARADVESTLGSPAQAGTVAVPVGVGAAAIAYNILIPGDLRLSQGVLADIYAGRIQRWRDPALLALNPGAVFPDLPIRVATGGNEECENALRAVIGEAAGHAQVRMNGPAKVSTWLKVNEGGLACVDAAFGRRNGLFLASLRNRSGKFVQPEARSVTRAAAGVRYPPDLRVSLADPEGADSYPLATLIYAALGTASSPASVEFLRWVLHDGQRHLVPMGAAPLPGLVVLQAEENLKATSPRGRASP